MADSENKLWGIHTRAEDLSLNLGRIVIGRKEMVDLHRITANGKGRNVKYCEAYTVAKKVFIPTSYGMLHCFCHEVQIGDYVVIPSKSECLINIGKVSSSMGT